VNEYDRFPLAPNLGPWECGELARMARNEGRERIADQPHPLLRARLEAAVSALEEVARVWRMRWKPSADGPSVRTSADLLLPSRHEGPCDTKEAAALLGVGERQVCKYIAADLLPAHKRGRRWVIERADLDKYASERERTNL